MGKYVSIHDPVYGDRYKAWLDKEPEQVGQSENDDLMIDLYYALVEAKARIKQLEQEAKAPF